ncbi:hypothetical protein V1508DRAFT_463020 [Lipomyces doorenjongii]|uniref:uncharacterized protein n=1 Tax=Lipomyces doorenjongii TaxID=383834 RepID=UPI0034CE7E41
MAYSLSDSFCTKFNISKPILPYYPGQQFTVVSHDPPEPAKGSCALNIHAAQERESKRPLERCILHPPLPGSVGPTTVYLKILETVRLGDNQSAQIAKVQVITLSHFYDSLYFDHEQDDANPFLCVDRDHSHEAAAYKALSVLQASTIPIYYGSYSMELPADATVRSGRLILMELVPGISIQ